MLIYVQTYIMYICIYAYAVEIVIWTDPLEGGFNWSAVKATNGLWYSQSFDIFYTINQTVYSSRGKNWYCCE